MAKKVRAKYRVSPPKVVEQEYTHCWMDESGSLQQEQRKREVELFMVHLPQGHSIRVNRDELKRLGYDRKPRLIDMETGDVLDHGGDPYDFGDATEDTDVIIQDDEE